MKTEQEIRQEFKDLHDVLSEDYYAGVSELNKAQFDAQHGKIWADLETALQDAGYRPPVMPNRDALAEMDALDARLKALEARQ